MSNGFLRYSVNVAASFLCFVLFDCGSVVSAQNEVNHKSKGESMNVLMVVTSNDELGSTGEKTGFWLEEFAAPFYVFKDAGADITIASPEGGQPPVDPRSDLPENQTEATKRFKADSESQELLAASVKLSGVNAADFDAVFYPGGHGPLWDLVDNEYSIALIQSFVKEGKPVGAVCHAPAVLKNVKDDNGEFLVKGRKVTGFSNTEETAVGLAEVVPFLLEDVLIECGGQYSKGDDWTPHVVEDGFLVTGQNPASSEKTAETLLKLIKS